MLNTVPRLDLGVKEGSCHGAGLDTSPGLDIGAEEGSCPGAGLDASPGLDIGAEEGSCHEAGLDTSPGLDIGAEEGFCHGAGVDISPGLDIDVPIRELTTEPASSPSHPRCTPQRAHYRASFIPLPPQMYPSESSLPSQPHPPPAPDVPIRELTTEPASSPSHPRCTPQRANYRASFIPLPPQMYPSESSRPSQPHPPPAPDVPIRELTTEPASSPSHPRCTPQRAHYRSSLILLPPQVYPSESSLPIQPHPPPAPDVPIGELTTNPASSPSRPRYVPLRELTTEPASSPSRPRCTHQRAHYRASLIPLPPQMYPSESLLPSQLHPPPTPDVPLRELMTEPASSSSRPRCTHQRAHYRASLIPLPPQMYPSESSRPSQPHPPPAPDVPIRELTTEPASSPSHPRYVTPQRAHYRASFIPLPPQMYPSESSLPSQLHPPPTPDVPIRELTTEPASSPSHPRCTPQRANYRASFIPLPPQMYPSESSRPSQPHPPPAPGVPFRELTTDPASSSSRPRYVPIRELTTEPASSPSHPRCTPQRANYRASFIPLPPQMYPSESSRPSQPHPPPAPDVPIRELTTEPASSPSHPRCTPQRAHYQASFIPLPPQMYPSESSLPSQPHPPPAPDVPIRELTTEPASYPSHPRCTPQRANYRASFIPLTHQMYPSESSRPSQPHPPPAPDVPIRELTTEPASSPSHPRCTPQRTHYRSSLILLPPQMYASESSLPIQPHPPPAPDVPIRELTTDPASSPSRPRCTHKRAHYRASLILLPPQM
uniref:flocculation protein FLO11-like n=1 Tax=Oncorhynchus gorbuscha TaxID=8017 RepID=UPI001EAF100D|nr:flocculation protein FLO11-like [Oncorhynchus gorbuscha]